MQGNKTYQKNWRFDLGILAQLKAIADFERRSEPNMLEVLISNRFQEVYGHGSEALADGFPIKTVEISRITDVES